ncbi:hypothetical protein [Cellvibrio fontiphilus]|uniref:Lipoprotein n=1 Tax=Cellvibrio fontiphilus TaxID=1815559 RepID=A0ABV7FG27_9GAMM
MNWLNHIKPALHYIILCAIILLGLVSCKNLTEMTGIQIIYVDNRHVENYVNKQTHPDYTLVFESDNRTVSKADNKYCNNYQ